MQTEKEKEAFHPKKLFIKQIVEVVADHLRKAIGNIRKSLRSTRGGTGVHLLTVRPMTEKKRENVAEVVIKIMTGDTKRSPATGDNAFLVCII